MIGKMPAKEIAVKLGTSISNLKRAFRGTRLAYFNKHVINQDRVKRVCAYYEKHGRPATEKAFPEVKVRSIVERYKFYRPRQTRWTDEQIVELARMAGLVSFDEQARRFARPGAAAGSIKSAWQKKFGFGGQAINGMSNWMAKEIVTKDCPRILSHYWDTKRAGKHYGRNICLWVDMEKHLRPGVPDFIVSAIKQMAEFQRWLHGRNAKANMMKLLET